MTCATTSEASQEAGEQGHATPMPLHVRLGRAFVAGAHVRGKGALNRWIIRHWTLRLSEAVFACRPGFLVTGDLSDDFLRELFWYGRYEPATTWFLQQLLTPQDAFYDVGANIGYFTLLAAAIIKQEGSVVAVEPNPVARERLLRNLELNRFRHVMVRSEALGSAAGAGTLSQLLGRSEWSTLAPPDGREAEGFPVEVRRLDDVVEETGKPPSVLKIDVEGWEGEVLLGAQAVLASPHAPVIVAEVSELLRSAPDEQVSGWLGELQGRGYEFLKLSHRARTLGRRLRLEPWSPAMARDPRELGFNIAAYIPDQHGDRVRAVLGR